MKKLIRDITHIQKITPINLIDVGARWGIKTPWDQISDYILSVYGFEADSKECQKLNESIQPGEKIKYFSNALLDKKSTATLYLTYLKGLSSVYKPDYTLMEKYFENDDFKELFSETDFPHENTVYKVQKEITVTTDTLNNILRQNKIKPDFIKIDTQGSELSILKGSDEILSETLGIEVEVEFLQLYQNQPIFSEIDTLLKKFGFELFDLNRYWAKNKILPNNCSSRGQLIFADAIYMRPFKNFSLESVAGKEQQREKILKMIIILSLYGYFDVAFEYLCGLEYIFSESEIELLKKTIIYTSSYPKWQKVLLNNNFANSFGLLLQYLGKIFSYVSRSSDWGTDYNNVNTRYLYHASNKINKYFGKK